MNHIIIRETASEMRAIARKALRGNWMAVAVTMAIYYILMVTLPLLMDELIPGASMSSIDEITGETVTLPIISTLYSLILTGPLTVGMGSFCLNFFRHKETHPGHLFDGFEYFLKAVLLTFLVGLYVFLWTLLLIVPGFIAVFRYSQAFYILADHPEYSVGECIRLSKEYMKDNKMKLFGFELSFLGWALLAGLSSIPLMWLPTTGILAVLADFVVTIPNFFFMAYNGIGCIVFYELVSGNLMAKPQEVPMDMSGIPTMVDVPVERETVNNDNDEFHF